MEEFYLTLNGIILSISKETVKYVKLWNCVFFFQNEICIPKMKTTSF